MILDISFFLLFSAMFVVFGSNVVQALTGKSVWARNTLVRKSENPIGIATIMSIFFGFVTLAMALLSAADLIGLQP